MRSSFRAGAGLTLVSADYSQLELRILAHLSADDVLCRILGRDGGDVFRLIASEWKQKVRPREERRRRYR